MPSQAKDNLGFVHAFIASLSVIVVSELGDKTFFIAAIMAMKHPRLTVFIGAISALALMTLLSGIIIFIKLYVTISEYLLNETVLHARTYKSKKMKCK